MKPSIKQMLKMIDLSNVQAIMISGSRMMQTIIKCSNVETDGIQIIEDFYPSNYKKGIHTPMLSVNPNEDRKILHVFFA